MLHDLIVEIVYWQTMFSKHHHPKLTRTNICHKHKGLARVFTLNWEDVVCWTTQHVKGSKKTTRLCSTTNLKNTDRLMRLTSQRYFRNPQLTWTYIPKISFTWREDQHTSLGTQSWLTNLDKCPRWEPWITSATSGGNRARGTAISVRMWLVLVVSILVTVGWVKLVNTCQDHRADLMASVQVGNYYKVSKMYKNHWNK